MGALMSGERDANARRVAAGTRGWGCRAALRFPWRFVGLQHHDAGRGLHLDRFSLLLLLPPAPAWS